MSDPVMAIWSLGQGGVTASFVFTPSEPSTILSGGPNDPYGGSSITTACAYANAVCGQEGNGTIPFQGWFTSISFTTPQAEDYYAFTVGAPGPVLGAGVPGLGCARLPGVVIAGSAAICAEEAAEGIMLWREA